MLYDGKATDALRERPKCDICQAKDGQVEPAAVDGATSGGWAYMCEGHFTEYGVGLGTGAGQVLLCGDDMDEVLKNEYGLGS